MTKQQKVQIKQLWQVESVEVSEVGSSGGAGLSNGTTRRQRIKANERDPTTPPANSTSQRNEVPQHRLATQPSKDLGEIIKNKRNHCSKEEKAEVMWCYEYYKQKTNGNYIIAYNLWRKINPNFRLYLDPNKLWNQKSYIALNNRLTPTRSENKKSVGKIIMEEGTQTQ